MNLICISCPRGCHLSVEKEGEKVIVTGNSCPRGEAYGISEITNPLRTLTTTVAIQSKDCHRLPLISSSPLPKDKLMDAMKAMKDVKIDPPVKLGDVVVENILDLGIDMLAAKSVNE